MVLFITAIIVFIVCSILLGALNKSKIKLFVSLQNYTSRLKRRKLAGGVSLIVLILICASLSIYFELSDFNYGLLLGFLLALQNIIFNHPIPDHK